MMRRRLNRGESKAVGIPPVDEVILHLRHVRSAAIVAVAALQRQNCELDEDIATLLRRCVCEPLADQLEKLEAARHPSAARMHRS